MTDQDRADAPVVLATFRYRHEAELARGVLEDEGIPSMLEADDGGGSYAGLSLSTQPRIRVRPEDEERARQLLEDAGLLDTDA